MQNFRKLALMSAMALLSSISMAAEPGRWERIKGYAHTEKEAAIADGKKVLDEIDAKIDDMKQHASHASGETKAAYERNLAELRGKRAEAQKHIEKMQQSGSEAWLATRDGFANAYQDLHQAYDKAAAAVKGK